MQLIIHRGAHEIGGSCVEIRTATNRLIIDFGLPLVNRQKERFDAKSLEGRSIPELKIEGILPPIEGFYNGDEKKIDGILISHSHPDHYGLLKYVQQDIPIYLSQGVKSLIEISDLFLPIKVGDISNRHRIIKHYEPFNIGNFEITPYQVDHSGFDAMAFLIEAEGKRFFYSGDFRGHGRKSYLFKNMIKHPPENIDYLLMEGTTLGRSKAEYKTEEEVQERFEKILKDHNNITFLFSSSQNIDRIVSAYKACCNTHTIFVIDIYTAYILDHLPKSIPKFNWRNIRIKYSFSHADKLAQSGHKDLLYKYNNKKIEIEEIRQNKNRILMLARDNFFYRHKIIDTISGLEGVKVLYSVWDGYLTPDFEEFCTSKGLVIEKIHTSGHAVLKDLQAFAKALNPKKLVPIHTEESDKYKEYFDNVLVWEDGDVYNI